MLNKIGILKNISSSFTAVLRGHIKDIYFSVCMKNKILKKVYLRSSITNFSTQSCYRIMTLPGGTRNMSCNSVSINCIVKINEWKFVPSVFEIRKNL